MGATTAAHLAGRLESLERTACWENAATTLTQLEQELRRVAAVFVDPGWWEEALRHHPTSSAIAVRQTSPSSKDPV
jgi:hypothetical protein